MSKRKFDDLDEGQEHPQQPPPVPSSFPSPTPQQRDRHFKDLYKEPPDFQTLALRDPDFAKFIKGTNDLDFRDPKAVMQLTKTLLKLDFDLTVDLPEDRLCPPVTVRHNYILWLKDLLDSTTYCHEPSSKKLLGLDIGTGASCIYPLLACRQRNWSFVATDIDERNIQYARENVRLNDLSSRVTVVGRPTTASLITEGNVSPIDFTMTNPPFYSSTEAMLEAAALKKREPFSACTGSPIEMVTKGGEVAFVLKILEESTFYNNRTDDYRRHIKWYTAMLGFLSSVTAIIGRLKEKGIENYAVTEFLQGSKTRRWAIGWSYGSMRPSVGASRGAKSVPRKMLPHPTEAQAFEGAIHPTDQGRFFHHVQDTVAGLDLTSWDWDAQMMQGTGRAGENVWKRAYRRMKKRDMGAGVAGGDKRMTDASVVHEKCAFGFRIAVSVSSDRTAVNVRWMEGQDNVLFESFQGWLKARCEAFQATKE